MIIIIYIKSHLPTHQGPTGAQQQRAGGGEEGGAEEGGAPCDVTSRPGGDVTS
jgi:hypothetical protein